MTNKRKHCFVIIFLMKIFYFSYLLFLLPTIEPKTTMPLDCPHLVATPDYPVAAGLTVELSCQTIIPSQNIIWSRSLLQNESWENVGSGKVLLLTEPKQTGTYRCEILNIGKCVSQNHNVYIVSISTAGQMFSGFFVCFLNNHFCIITWFCMMTIHLKTSSQLG